MYNMNNKILMMGFIVLILFAIIILSFHITMEHLISLEVNQKKDVF